MFNNRRGGGQAGWSWELGSSVSYSPSPRFPWFLAGRHSGLCRDVLEQGSHLGRLASSAADGGGAWGAELPPRAGRGCACAQGVAGTAHEVPGSRGFSHVGGLMLSPVLLTPMPNAQGGTTGSRDHLTRAAQAEASSVSPCQKASSHDSVHPLGLLRPPDHPIQLFNLCEVFNNT